MIPTKMAELRHIVISWGPFCSFSNFEFFVLRLALTNTVAATPHPTPSLLWRRHVAATVARGATVERRVVEGW